MIRHVGQISLAHLSFPIWFDESKQAPFVRISGALGHLTTIYNDTFPTIIHNYDNSISLSVLRGHGYGSQPYPGSQHLTLGTRKSLHVEHSVRGWIFHFDDSKQEVFYFDMEGSTELEVLLPVEILQTSVQELFDWYRSFLGGHIPVDESKEVQVVPTLTLQRDARMLLSPPSEQDLFHQLKELLKKPPSSSAWFDLLQHLAMWPDELAIDAALQMTSQEVKHWPPKLKEVPAHSWFSSAWLSCNDPRLHLCRVWNVFSNDSVSPLFDYWPSFIEDICLPHVTQLHVHNYGEMNTFCIHLERNQNLSNIKRMTVSNCDVFDDTLSLFLEMSILLDLSYLESSDNPFNPEELTKLIALVNTTNIKELNLNESVEDEHKHFVMENLSSSIQVNFGEEAF